jgi:hypothetical protein
MTWTGELFLMLNSVLFMIVFSFVLQTVTRQVGIMVTFCFKRYYEERKAFCEEMIKLQHTGDTDGFRYN